MGAAPVQWGGKQPDGTNRVSPHPDLASPTRPAHNQFVAPRPRLRPGTYGIANVRSLVSGGREEVLVTAIQHSHAGLTPRTMLRIADAAHTSVIGGGWLGQCTCDASPCRRHSHALGMGAHMR